MDVLEGLNVLITISGTCIEGFIHAPTMYTTKTLKLIDVDCKISIIHLLSISVSLCVGKKNKLRLYYLSWLRNKILHNDPEVEKRQGWTSVGDLEGCVHYKVGKYTLRRAS